MLGRSKEERVQPADVSMKVSPVRGELGSDDSGSCLELLPWGGQGLLQRSYGLEWGEGGTTWSCSLVRRKLPENAAAPVLLPCEVLLEAS